MPTTDGRASALTAGTLVTLTDANPAGRSGRHPAGLTVWVKTVDGDTTDTRMDKDSTAILDHYDSPYPGADAECLLPGIPLSQLQARSAVSARAAY